MGVGGAPVTPVDKSGNVIGPSGGTGPSTAQVGAVNETAPASDTASSGLNGRLQRIAQRITSLIAIFTSATVTDYSITNMSGASQSVVGAGNGTKLIYLQALATNVGTVWINLAGGTAVAGSGVPIAPGGYVTLQPGIANAITGIAAAANDDLTVYAG